MKRVRIIYKLKDNRGSGGGADDTRRESAQALYAASCIWTKKKNYS